RISDELRAVIATDVLGRSVACYRRFHYPDHIRRANRPVHMCCQAFARVFVYKRQHAKAAPVLGLIMYEVPTPHVSRTFRPLSLRGRCTWPLRLALPFSHLQTFLSPHPGHPLLIYHEAFPPQQRRDPPVAVARMWLWAGRTGCTLAARLRLLRLPQSSPSSKPAIAWRFPSGTIFLASCLNLRLGTPSRLS